MELVINNSLLAGKTFLSKDVISGTAINIPVENSEQLSISYGKIVIGVIGSPNAEALTLSSKTATTLSFSGSTNFTHLRGEPVQQVTYDKIVIESGTTSAGPFTTVATIDVQWSADSTVWVDPTGTTTTYYRQRFYNSVTNQYSDYSNGGVGVAQTDYGVNTVGYLISSVRKAVGNTELPDDFFISALDDARKIVDSNFGFGRQNEWRFEFDYPIQMLAGTNYVSLPSNIDFSETNRSIINARYARFSIAGNLPLKYIDKKTWNNYIWQMRWTYTSGAVLSGASTITVENSGDFPASGTFYIATESPTQTVLSVSYTGNNLATNTFTGCTGITRNISSGVQVAAYPITTLPLFFTVFENKLWFNSFIPSTLQGKNVYIDYVKRMERLNYLTDVIPEKFRDIYKDYLKFAIKRRRDDSIGEDDQDYIKFKNAAATVLGNPYTGQSQIIIS